MLNKLLHRSFLFISIAFSTLLFGQKKVSLTEASFVVKNRNSERFYFGLAAGDKIEFNITTTSIKRISFEEYKGGSLFELSNPDSIINHTLEIEHDGIYYFSFEQSGFLAGKSYCSLNATRTPNSKEKEKFNTTVYWKTQIDSIKYIETEKYINRIDTIVTNIVDQYTILKHKASVDYTSIMFNLPENSTSWSYLIMTGKEAQNVFMTTEKKFSNNSTFIKKYGLMAGIALNGIASFPSNPKCREVKYCFIKKLSVDSEVIIDSLNSIEATTKTCLDFGKVVNINKKPTHIFIQNLSKKTVPIYVRITSLEIIERWSTREIEKFRIEAKDIPYLKN